MENKRVFIGNLSFEVTEEDIRTLFSDFGTVAGITLRRKKGFAFVEMGNVTEAAEAVEKLTGMKFQDREIRISLEMKSARAKKITLKNYRERESSLYRERAAMNSDPRSRREKHRDSSQFDSDNREGIENSGAARRKHQSDYKSEGRFAGKNSNAKSDSSGEKKPRWSTKRTSDSPASQNKKWSGDSKGKIRDSWREGPAETGSSEDKGSDRKKTRPVSASQNRFSRSSGPKEGGGSRKGSSGPSWPISRGGAPGRKRKKRD